MTKADIVNEITKNTGIDKVTVLTTLEAFMDTVKDSLSKEELLTVLCAGTGKVIRHISVFGQPKMCTCVVLEVL